MKLVYWILLLVVVAVFGSNYTAVRLGIDYSAPIAFSVLRVGGACLVSVPFSIYAIRKIQTTKQDKDARVRQLPTLDKKTLAILALFGATSSTFFFGFWFAGENLTSASVSAVIVNTTPIFTVLFTRFLIKERIAQKQVIGLAVGLLGAFIVASNGSVYNLYGDWRGFAFLFLSAASLAGSLIVYQKWLTNYEQNTVNTFQLMFGAIGLLIWAVVTDPNFLETIVWSNHTFQVAFLYATLTVAPLNLAWMALVRQRGPAWFASWLFLNPVFGVIISSIVLGEGLFELQIVGMVLVIFSIYEINRTGFKMK